MKNFCFCSSSFFPSKSIKNRTCNCQFSASPITTRANSGSVRSAEDAHSSLAHLFFVKVLDCSASVFYFTFGLSGIHQEESANSCLLSDCPPVPVLELRAAMQRDENIEPGGLRANNWSIGNSPNEIRSLQKKRSRFVSYHKVAPLQY